MEVTDVRPVIAMPRMNNSPFRIYMKSKYVKCLKECGADVRWIDLKDPAKAAKDALECDGLLLPGGGDMDPAIYGQTKKTECGKPDPVRDAAELKMLEAFIPTRKPILGICRGIQVLNVYLGGTLHQDIKLTQGRKHQYFRKRKVGSHQVKLVPRARFSKLLGCDQMIVNSMHHQAIDQLGPGLTIAAVSEDGFIEGVELFLHPFCVGVQWHPEHMADDHPLQMKIFEEFVSACKK